MDKVELSPISDVDADAMPGPSTNPARDAAAELGREHAPCPCTLIEQDESCPIGYPSMICRVCNGTGSTSSEKIAALAAEMLRIASDLGEAEDPFAAWEVLQNLGRRELSGSPDQSTERAWIYTHRQDTFDDDCCVISSRDVERVDYEPPTQRALEFRPCSNYREYVRSDVANARVAVALTGVGNRVARNGGG